MPFKSIWERHGLLTQWWGNATVAELVQMQEQAHATPDFDAARYSIHDFSECDHFAFDPNTIQYSAAIDEAASAANARVKIAVVAANHEVVEMVKAYMNEAISPYPVRIFSSMEEARSWVEQVS